MKILIFFTKWQVCLALINISLMLTFIKERCFSCLLFFVLLIVPAGCQYSGKPKNKTSRVNSSGLVLHTEYLDRIVLENSGLVWYRDKLWTINDSGGDPVLFSIDKQTGKCIQAIYIEGASNRDWEELAQDEDYIYIFDIGNNYGRREELTIYKILKDSIPLSGNARIVPEIIRYQYGDREKSSGHFTRSSYDCEAAFVWNDSLYLFTKDWENRQTALYTCSANPGTYTLWPVAYFAADGLVTGADISPVDSSLILLVGYKDYVPFIWEIHGFNYSNYSMESAKRFDFPEKYDLQTEGIAIQGDDLVYVSCEMSSWPASIYTLNLEDQKP